MILVENEDTDEKKICPFLVEGWNVFRNPWEFFGGKYEIKYTCFNMLGLSSLNDLSKLPTILDFITIIIYS